MGIARIVSAPFRAAGKVVTELVRRVTGRG
jgi:hypothetical protein